MNSQPPSADVHRSRAQELCHPPTPFRSPDVEQVASGLVLEGACLPSGARVGGTVLERPRGRRPPPLEEEVDDVERRKGGCPRTIVLLPGLKEATGRLLGALRRDADARRTATGNPRCGRHRSRDRARRERGRGGSQGRSRGDRGGIRPRLVLLRRAGTEGDDQHSRPSAHDRRAWAHDGDSTTRSRRSPREPADRARRRALT